MTKPAFPKWTNPYIDKVETLPAILAPCYAGAPSDEEIATFKERASRFSRIICEFGCGSGKHLNAVAATDDRSFFVGFELRYKRAFRAAAKAQRRPLDNIFVFRTTVAHLPELFAENSIDGVFVNFPDPWDKKRWAGNRMLNPDMIGILSRLMKQNGFLSYKTDHVDRFREVVGLMKEHDGFEIESSTEDLHGGAGGIDNVITEFEELFLSKGMSICRLQARRT